MTTLGSIKTQLFIACCFLLTSCASLTTPDKPSDTHIESLIEAGEFNAALRTVNAWQLEFPDNANVINQRKRITAAIYKFEKHTLRVAKQQENDNQWQDARSTYKSALAAVPSSKAIQNAYSEFSLRHLAYINKLQEKLDVEHAQHWLAMANDINSLYAAAPDNDEAQAWKHTSVLERQHLSKRLIDYGIAHEKDKHFGTAALRFDLAHRLAPGDSTQPYYQRAKEYLSKRDANLKKQAAKKQKLQLSKFNQLLAEFDDSIAKEEFRLARQTLHALEVIDADSAEVAERKALLNKQKNSALARAIKEGKIYYTQGNFDKAIERWRYGLELDPKNKELKKNIQRARKFQANLQRLTGGSTGK